MTARLMAEIGTALAFKDRRTTVEDCIRPIIEKREATLRRQLAASEAREARLAAVVTKLQWSANRFPLKLCPFCQAGSEGWMKPGSDEIFEGHKPGCELSAALAASDAGEEGR